MEFLRLGALSSDDEALELAKRAKSDIGFNLMVLALSKGFPKTFEYLDKITEKVITTHTELPEEIIMLMASITEGAVDRLVLRLKLPNHEMELFLERLMCHVNHRSIFFISLAETLDKSHFRFSVSYSWIVIFRAIISRGLSASLPFMYQILCKSSHVNEKGYRTFPMEAPQCPCYKTSVTFLEALILAVSRGMMHVVPMSINYFFQKMEPPTLVRILGACRNASDVHIIRTIVPYLQLGVMDTLRLLTLYTNSGRFDAAYQLVSLYHRDVIIRSAETSEIICEAVSTRDINRHAMQLLSYYYNGPPFIQMSAMKMAIARGYEGVERDLFLQLLSPPARVYVV